MENPNKSTFPYDDLTDKEFTAPQPLLILKCTVKLKLACTLDCVYQVLKPEKALAKSGPFSMQTYRQSLITQILFKTVLDFYQICQ